MLFTAVRLIMQQLQEHPKSNQHEASLSYVARGPHQSARAAHNCSSYFPIVIEVFT